MSLEDRVGLFRADIAASPDALTALLDRWQPIDLGGRRHVVAFGLGSSRFAALVAAAAARARGAKADAEYAGAGIGPPPAPDLVAVCISASGRTPEVVEVAERHRGRSLVVGVTNDTTSPLALAADLLVSLHAGAEAAGISSRTYRATLAALALLLGVADADRLRGLLPSLQAAIDEPTWHLAAADLLDGAPAIDVVAPASLLGAAEQAALMLREAPRLPAHAAETADWSHTHVYLALPGHRVLRLSGSHQDRDLDAILERRGGRAVDVPIHGSDDVERAILASVAVERLAVELWERVDAGEPPSGSDDKEP